MLTSLSELAQKTASSRMWADLHIHALNTVIMFSDAFLGRMWHAARNVYLPVVYAGVYALFSVYVHSEYSAWPYSFQDPAQNSQLTLTYMGLSLVLIVAWCGALRARCQHCLC